MDDKELERRLKKEAEKIETKSFSERWERIQPRLEHAEVLQEQFEPELVPIAETGVAPKSKRIYKKSFLICGICMLVCAVVLAIVLPLTLGESKNSDKLYYHAWGLLHRVSDQEEFYREMDAAGIFIPDFSECEINSYGLLVTSENVTKGWELDYYDVKNESSVGLNIYLDDVILRPRPPQQTEISSTTTVNGVFVQYSIYREDDAYMLWAIATYRNCGYQFEILSANENILAVLETLFQ